MTATSTEPAAAPASTWTLHLLTTGPGAFEALMAAIPAGSSADVVEQMDDAIRAATAMLQRGIGRMGAADGQEYNVRIVGSLGSASTARAVSIEVAEYSPA